MKVTAYGSTDEFLADLMVIRDSLYQNGGKDIANGLLRVLIQNVNAFGFHLAPVDVRQNSAVHVAVISELFDHVGVVDYKKLSETEKIELLSKELLNKRPLVSKVKNKKQKSVFFFLKKFGSSSTMHTLPRPRMSLPFFRKLQMHTKR